MGKSIAIIGGGISGLMCAYRLQLSNKDIEITLFDKGTSIDKRSCPVVQHKSEKCVKCNHCAIMEGIGGAGAFSDGKYNITTEFGGWLQEFIGDEPALEYMRQANHVLNFFGASSKTYYPNDDIKIMCAKHDLNMLQAQVRHLGTDNNFWTMIKIIDDMTKHGKFEIKSESEVTDVRRNNGKYTLIYRNDIQGLSEDFDIVIFAVGRTGSKFLSEWCKRNKVNLTNNQVDVGVRVELPAFVWSYFEQEIYEPKILYKTNKYGDICRMFCFNGRGEVVTENTDGILTVNGHAYEADNLKTDNTNFAILVSMRFDDTFENPISYCRNIAKSANMLTGGTVLVQRFEDIKKYRRTNQKRLAENSVKPTLKAAVPGDLSLCIPKRQMDDIIEFIEKLNEIAPGTANKDTLLYGVECKYYSARPEITDNFELVNFENCYAIGDGAGVTRSLSQAAANGLYVADTIIDKI